MEDNILTHGYGNRMCIPEGSKIMMQELGVKKGKERLRGIIGTLQRHIYAPQSTQTVEHAKIK